MIYPSGGEKPEKGFSTVLAAIETHDMATRPAKCCKACDYSPPAVFGPLFSDTASDTAPDTVL
jgi:hypothetical protein